MAIKLLKPGNNPSYEPNNKIIRVHTCYRCGAIYEYIEGEDACNDYVDQEDFNHYDCPTCGLKYYPVWKFFQWLYYKLNKKARYE